MQKENMERGYIPLFSTNRNFWKAMDSINDSDNVLRVETHIRDPAPLDFSLHNDKTEGKKVKVEKEKDGNVRL